MNWIFFGIWLAACCTPVAQGSGVFELRLLGFDNPHGLESNGECCGHNCSCSTRFRVCLKHYQAQVDPNTPCIFGDVVTPVVGHNSILLPPTGITAGFTNPINFHFDFTWPESFTLIVEAWHDTNTSTRLSSNKTLIARLSTQKWVQVGPSWTVGEERGPLKYEYRVSCDDHYYGKGCATLCRPRNDSFGHYVCSESGSRLCLQGWTGEYCSDPKCLSGCDAQHGHCNQPNECLCHSGWKGALCDECERYPGCLHGSCEKPWDCLCDEGWGGLFCNQDLNYCTNHRPCKNAGTCFNTGQGSYTCACPPGFTGTDCEVRVDGCSHSPCRNGGTCNDGGGEGGYRCSCPSGWRGKHCEEPIVRCGDLPCLNGGTCEDRTEGFECRCPPGWGGPRCEEDPCSRPCHNGGTCTEGVCLCPRGFSGSRCETDLDDCAHSPCNNGGTCVDGADSFRCQCVPGFVGHLCQNQVDYCVAKPCANGGLCSNLVNDYKCACRAGFVGKDCSVDVDECASNPCRNGGRCSDRVNGYECRCPPGRTGPRCDDRPGKPGDISRHVAGGSDRGLTTEHVVVIATLSTAVPLAVCVAAVVVCALKRRRDSERRKEDEAARRDNERNTSAVVATTKQGEMIKNTWTRGDETWEPPAVFGLSRSRSQKQLNTEPWPKRASLLSEPPISNTSEVVKRPLERDTGFLKPPPSIYVIEDHLTRPATQV